VTDAEVTIALGHTLITGAGGLVGSAVVRTCVARGISIRAHLGPPGAGVTPPPAGIESAFAEIDNVEAMTELCRDVAAVVHLAGPPSVAKSFHTPAECVRAHAVGTASILEACRANAVRRLIYVSSAEVYGRPQVNPVAEDHPRQPQSPYGIAKVCAEDLITACSPNYGIFATILRPFSVIGPPLAAHSVLGSIIRQAIAGPTVALFAPHVVRDYLFVDDLADAILSSLVIQGEPGEVEAYNVGSGVGTSVAMLAAMVQEKLGSPASVCPAEGFDRPKAADTSVLIADITRAKNQLGWRPQTSLSDSLSFLISLQRKQELNPCAF
jgi:nucleoside-diphosphate-sugar epimerase